VFTGGCDRSLKVEFEELPSDEHTPAESAGLCRVRWFDRFWDDWDTYDEISEARRDE